MPLHRYIRQDEPDPQQRSPLQDDDEDHAMPQIDEASRSIGKLEAGLESLRAEVTGNFKQLFERIERLPPSPTCTTRHAELVAAGDDIEQRVCTLERNDAYRTGVIATAATVLSVVGQWLLSMVGIKFTH